MSCYLKQTNQSPPAKRHKPLPDPPANTVQPLPAEVLHRIIDFISPNDKRTLGLLMRVSSALNAIAARKLYHTITIGEYSGFSDPFGGNSRRGPFDIPVKKAWMKKSKMKQKSQGKEKDLGHVRHIFFGDTADPDILKVWPSEKRTDQKNFYNAITSVRFDIPSGSSYVPRPYGGFIDGTLVRLTRVEKLVLATPYIIAIGDRSFAALSPNWSKVVIILDTRIQNVPCISQSRPALGKPETLNTVVYAFRSLEVTYMHERHIQRSLARAATRGDAQLTMLFVNAEKTRGVADFQQQVELQIARIKDEDSARTAPSAPDDTAQPPRYPTVRFLTMREYLRDYDWAGEFTEQEVRPWLEEEEAERIAEIEGKAKEREEEAKDEEKGDQADA